MNVERFPNATKLDLCTQRPDLRRDLHQFVGYFRDRDVKRAHRDNSLPRADTRRLAKLMSDPQAEQECESDGYSAWIDLIDGLTLRLGFVQYDIKGSYAGYTSHEPTFPDNFVTVQEKTYDSFCRKTLAQQELQLLDLLIQGPSVRNTGCDSEFFRSTFGSRMDRFYTAGCAVGVVPMLDFPQARRFLLNQLAELTAGEWLSTASLIALIKRHHRYFLIPKKLEFKNKWEKDRKRYDNFCEGDPFKSSCKPVAESDEDAFERVEGRFIERFLEWIPHLLGYVDLAYARQFPKSCPHLGALPAFRVSERMRRALAGGIAEPKVQVTPNFEVYVQSEVFPARVIQQLQEICELVSSEATTVFRLTRQKVAAAQAADHRLDAIRLLDSLSATPVPDNVRRELVGWSEHSEKFILYSGFALLETEPDVAVPAAHQVASIEAGKYIVKSADALFNELERRERVPIKVTHQDASFSAIPDGVHSALRGRKRRPAKLSVDKPRITLMKFKRVQLMCPDRDFLHKLRCVLLGAGCPVEADPKNLTLVYSDRYETEVGKAIRGLKNDYQVTIEDQV
jgi:hypothetical protein